MDGVWLEIQFIDTQNSAHSIQQQDTSSAGKLGWNDEWCYSKQKPNKLQYHHFKVSCTWRVSSSKVLKYKIPVTFLLLRSQMWRVLPGIQVNYHMLPYMCKCNAAVHWRLCDYGHVQPFTCMARLFPPCIKLEDIWVTECLCAWSLEMQTGHLFITHE